MTPSPPTVFVVDDDASVRRALQRLLQSAGHRVELFSGARAFLDVYKPEWRGCLLLDLRMPGLGGLELQERLAAIEGTLPIVFITGHGDVPQSVKAMKGGAIDFIPKPFDDQTLLAAVEEALKTDERNHAARQRRDVVLARIGRLTPRERQVFDRVCAGMSNKQIAFDLGASEKTIKIHRGRVMHKLQAQSLAELVRMAQLAGSTDPH